MTISVTIKKFFIKFSSNKSAFKRGENRVFGTVACACLDTRGVASLRRQAHATKRKASKMKKIKARRGEVSH